MCTLKVMFISVCLFSDPPYVCFQIGLIILFRSWEHMALIIQSYEVLLYLFIYMLPKPFGL